MRGLAISVCAALFVFGMVALGSGVSAAPSQLSMRPSLQSPAAAHAITVGKKKKKHKKHKVADTANFNSCSVVTQAEAASALGQSVAPGVLGNATVEGVSPASSTGPRHSPRTPRTWPRPTASG